MATPTVGAMRRVAILAVALALPVSVVVWLQTARSAPPVRIGAAELPKPDPALRELIGFRVRYRDLLKRRITLVRQLTIAYTAWDGARRTAVVVLPKWYGPGTNPAIPLLISPHGRGGTAQANARLWGVWVPEIQLPVEASGRSLIQRPV